jgi:hypothetical protein
VDHDEGVYFLDCRQVRSNGNRQAFGAINW